MMVMSRSPKTTMAAVRGMGVAVMTSRSGSRPVPSSPRPLSRRAARCSTPKRCCSSMTTTPRERKATWSVSRAWVPTRMSTVPSASPAWMPARSAAPVRLVSRATRRGRRPSRVPGRGRSGRASSARTSLGVLLGQHLGRGHQGALVAPLDWRSAGRPRPPPSCPSRRRPAAAGAWAAGRPGRDRMAAMASRWAPVRSEGQAVEEPLDQGRGRLRPRVDHVADARGRPRCRRGLAQHQGQLEPEQLVEGQPPPGRLASRPGRPAVDAVEGGGPVDQAEAVPPRGSSGSANAPARSRASPDQPADAGRREVGLLGQRIDRDRSAPIGSPSSSASAGVAGARGAPRRWG